MVDQRLQTLALYGQVATVVVAAAPAAGLASEAVDQTQARRQRPIRHAIDPGRIARGGQKRQANAGRQVDQHARFRRVMQQRPVGQGIQWTTGSLLRQIAGRERIDHVLPGEIG